MVLNKVAVATHQKQRRINSKGPLIHHGRSRIRWPDESYVQNGQYESSTTNSDHQPESASSKEKIDPIEFKYEYEDDGDIEKVKVDEENTDYLDLIKQGPITDQPSIVEMSSNSLTTITVSVAVSLALLSLVVCLVALWSIYEVCKRRF